MNYLFHLYLSGDDPEILVGNLAGDFVKGRIGDDFSPGLATGLRLHRRIDSFAQNHPCFVRSRNRLSPELGLYRGVVVDLCYDHFLSLNWSAFAADPLDRYLDRVRSIVEARKDTLPQRLQNLLPLIFDDFIPSYRTVSGIDHALKRLSHRIRQPNPLPAGGAELARHYDGLHRDFLAFLPEVGADARSFLAERIGSR
ncbi:acyl carrier protein phosphodiesterase [Geomesophilobacter sediminis]|uniref:DUF479 domain-containing protein n=1 Tax=Geomesophilobacter sediminis TaxID=2798584 RepID=A0A8J7LYN0_9BACT|nr:ACP phosphodiesterase [Geomesophilobacter sediminis]MBJ6725281.1 DUF479 domain-containing protein [Geomesophilobacter sediminis]